MNNNLNIFIILNTKIKVILNQNILTLQQLHIQLDITKQSNQKILNCLQYIIHNSSRYETHQKLITNIHNILSKCINTD